MTKPTGTPKRRKEYDYLDKKGTTRTRHDYIETNYVNGVKGVDGEIAIRPMTKEEKQWLSQFIEETEHGNLNKTKQIKHEIQERKKIKSDWVFAKKKGNVDEMLRLEKLMDEKTNLIETLRDNSNNFYSKEEDVLEILGRDNERRRDLYNTAKISDNLVMYDIWEYDKFSTEALTDVDPELILMEQLHYVPKKKKK